MYFLAKKKLHRRLCYISNILSFSLNFLTEPGSTPRNLSARPLSASTMVIQWDEPEDQNGLVTVSSLQKIMIYLPTNIITV